MLNAHRYFVFDIKLPLCHVKMKYSILSDLCSGLLICQKWAELFVKLCIIKKRKYFHL